MPNQDADPGEAAEPLTSRRAASAGRRRSDFGQAPDFLGSMECRRARARRARGERLQEVARCDRVERCRCV
jgi:hypothetical protein